MKRKLFGFSFIALILIQLFSPWTIQLENGNIKSKINKAQAAEAFTPKPQIGYIKDYTDGAGTKYKSLVFVYVDKLKSEGECYDTDINFFVSNPSGTWDYVDETIDSYSDCTNSLNDWYTEQIDVINDGKTVKARRHYYGDVLDEDFPIKAHMEEGGWVYDSWIVVNPNKTYGDNTKEILITDSVKSFGPTPSQDMLHYMDGTKEVSENSINAAFGVEITSKPYIHDTDNNKIVGEYNITITNKGEMWQDNGETNGVADEKDNYGAWDSIYDSNLLSGDAGVKTDITPDNDGKTGRFSSYDGFILDISTSKDFKGTDTSSINLNKLILEGKEGGKIPLFDAGKLNIRVVTGFDASKSFIANPDEALDLPSLSENTTYYYRVRIYPDNKREKFDTIGNPISILTRFEDPEIVGEGAINIGNKSDLTVIQNSRTGVSLIEASGQNSDPAFLPECGVAWLPGDGTLTGCVIQVFYYLIFVPSAWLLGIAGTILDYVLAYAISPGAYTATYITDSWKFIRDICNLGFIFVLIYIAFRTIFGLSYGAKKTIASTIIVAVLINFSYPLTTVVIDASNILARQLYYNAFSQDAGEDGKPISLSATAADGFDPQSLISEGLQSSGDKASEQRGTIFIVLLMGVIFNIIAMIMFLKIAMMFIYRVIGLVFAIILSPFAVFTMSLGGEHKMAETEYAGWKPWLNGLLKDAFQAPIFIFFILIMVSFVSSNPFIAAFAGKNDPSQGAILWWMSLIIPFAMIMAFLKIIEKVTGSMSGGFAGMAASALGGVITGAAGMALGLATGGAAWVGRNAIGKRASEFMESKKGEALADRASKGNLLARMQMGILDRSRKGSFDVRQTALGNKIPLNLNAGLDKIPYFGKQFTSGYTAGGYMSQRARKNKEIKEIEDSYGFNQHLYDELSDKKKAQEEKVLAQSDIVEAAQDEANILLQKRNRLPKGTKEYEKAADLLDQKLAQVKIEKDKKTAMQNGGVWVNEQGEAIQERGVKEFEKDMDVVQKQRINNFRKFQREKSGYTFGTKNGLEVEMQKVETDMNSKAEKDREDVSRLRSEIAQEAKKDVEWATADLDKKKEIIEKKKSELIKKYAKERIFNSLGGKGKNKAEEEANRHLAHEIENSTYRLNSSPTLKKGADGENLDIDFHQRLMARFRDSFIHIDQAAGAAYGAGAGALLGWGAAPVGLAAGLVRFAEFDPTFYRYYGHEHHEKQPHFHAHDTYKPGGGGGGKSHSSSHH